MTTMRALLRAASLLTALVLVSFCAFENARAAPVSRVDSIGITVSDMDRALAFYTGVLPFEVVSETEVQGEAYEHLFGVFGMRARIVRLRLGAEEIELIDFLAPEGRPVPVDSRSNDEWFQHIAMIVSDMDAAYEQLREHNVQHASTGPQTLPDWNPNAGGIKAFYFKDSDGHNLEILQFPPDKGAARWHERGDDLFLGIDHTAIVVRDTPPSLDFFQHALGLKVRGTSENYGPEQERLNNVFGARLLITSLGAPEGPAVEFLDYLAPATGRPAPLDTQASDLWHWQIRMATPDLDGLEKTLREAGAAFVSPGIVEMPDDALALGRALMVRSPAGHALLISEAR
jgi:catechol 2,3-dioxygenase-like lactoylglutathione lyase family enzyme